MFQEALVGDVILLKNLIVPGIPVGQERLIDQARHLFQILKRNKESLKVFADIRDIKNIEDVKEYLMKKEKAWKNGDCASYFIYSKTGHFLGSLDAYCNGKIAETYSWLDAETRGKGHLVSAKAILEEELFSNQGIAAVVNVCRHDNPSFECMKKHMKCMGYIEAPYQGIHPDRAKEYATCATSWIKTVEMWHKSQRHVVSPANRSQDRLAKGGFSHVYS